MKLILFEDTSYSDLFPLSQMRGTFDIKTGVFSNYEYAKANFSDKYSIGLLSRKLLEPYLKETYKDVDINGELAGDTFFINGKARLSEEKLEDLLGSKNKDHYLAEGETIITAYVSAKKIDLFKGSDLSNGFSIKDLEEAGLKRIDNKPDDHEVYIFRYPWDVIKHIEETVEEDIQKILSFGRGEIKALKAVDIINDRNVFIHELAKVQPHVVLDASHGGIVIEENAVIEPFTYIKGPAFIGRNSLVKSGAKIYGPCVIGGNSKVAGEIAESVFHAYVNKQHDGFVGHSYICPFVNLGADTVTSDLKNNYSKIRMNVSGSEVDTNMQFIGSIIGDHSKAAINTMLNTGTVAGIFANLFGGGFPPKRIGSFSWIETGKPALDYDIEKALSTAKIVMSRRNITLSPAYESLMREYSKK